MPNRADSHPYQEAIPPEYRQADRWFLLDTSLDRRSPELGTELPVFAPAPCKARAPRGSGWYMPIRR